MIPKLTTPFTKAIRTLEGILLAAATVAPWVVTLVNPADLSKPDAAKWSVIAAGILTASRTLIKVVGDTKTLTGVQPESVNVEQLAKNLAAHIGVALPSTDALKGIVADAVAAAHSIGSEVSGIEKGASTSAAEQLAATPVSAGSPPDGRG